MVWKKLGSTTLSSYAEHITYSITSSKFVSFMIHGIPDSTVHASFQFNSDTGQSYNNTYETNGGTNYTDASQTKLRISPDGHTTPEFFITNMANFSGSEKILISHCVYQNTAGAGTAPARIELTGKWTGTAEVSAIKFYENTQAGGYTTGTNITTLGSDGVESLGVQDGAIYYETDTNKEFLLYNNTWTEL